MGFTIDGLKVELFPAMLAFCNWGADFRHTIERHYTAKDA